MSPYCHLTIRERELIYLYQGLHFSIRRIAKALKRNPATISRELKRGTTHDQYFPVEAHQLYQQRKRACGRRRLLATHPDIKALVIKLIIEYQWSPEQIAHRLKFEQSSMQISTLTIYRALYRGELDSKHLAHGAKGIQRCLRHRGKSRHTRNYLERRGQINIVHTIDERPEAANSRRELGHWEADTIVGQRRHSCLVTMVDRKTRYLLAKKATKKTAHAVNLAILSLIRPLRIDQLRSITPDRGSEFAKHAQITDQRSVEFYFPDAHAPWERGTNENTNGLIREYFPKKTDLNNYSAQEIKHIVTKINQRPRKCLNWQTPDEVYHQRVLHLI